MDPDTSVITHGLEEWHHRHALAEKKIAYIGKKVRETDDSILVNVVYNDGDETLLTYMHRGGVIVRHINGAEDDEWKLDIIVKCMIERLDSEKEAP